MIVLYSAFKSNFDCAKTVIAVTLAFWLGLYRQASADVMVFPGDTNTTNSIIKVQAIGTDASWIAKDVVKPRLNQSADEAINNNQGLTNQRERSL